jgi:hypothetical protein
MSITLKAGTSFLAAIFVAGLVVSEAEARPARSGQVPNGTTLGCATCHVSAGGGGPRNSFGTQVEGDFLSQAGFAGVVQWGPELAALDADGDGATNGEELGDPDGSWVQGDANPAGEVFRPWDAESTPLAPMPTAVESSGWAEIKRFVAQD